MKTPGKAPFIHADGANLYEGQDRPLMTPKERRQMDAMVELGQTLPDDQDKALISKALMFCPLPYRRTEEKQLVKECRVPGGNIQVVLNALDDKIPLPFGNDAFVLDLLSSQARYRKSPEIKTDHLADLMRLLGHERLSGRDYREFMERIRRIGAFAMRVKRRGSLAINARVVDVDGSAFWGAQDIKRESRGEQPLAPYVIRLSPEYYADLMTSYAALPFEVLAEFKGSPTEYSLVKWLWLRADVSTSATVVPWEELLEERGSNDSNVWRFQTQVRTVLAKLAPARPEVGRLFEVKPGGLFITPLDSITS